MSTQNAQEVDDLTSDDIHEEESAVDHFLGDAFNIDRAGIVRPGIMVPKAGTPDALVKKYHEMAKQGVSWDAISEAMGKDGKGKSWLTMRNVDYFTVRPQDCENPVFAQIIRQKYATDGILKRIPISFPFDDISMLIDVRLSAYSATGLVASGRYQGDKLICQKPKPKPAAEQGKYQDNHKTFGKPEFDKAPCDPDKCQLYQNKTCKMRGGLIFRIPGVPGIGVWALYTSSFYTLRGVRDKLRAIKQMLNGWGTLSTLPNVFYLKKFKKRVGADQRDQWLVTIDTDETVDDIVARVKEEHIKWAPRAVSAAAKLNGTTKQAPAAPEPEFEELPLEPEEAAEASLEEPPVAPPVSAPSVPAPAPSQPAGQKDLSVAHPEPTPPQPGAQSQSATAAPQQPAKLEPSKKPATAQSSAPTAGSLQKNLEMFLGAILKNPALKTATKDQLYDGVDSFCMKSLNKPINTLDQKEASTLISFLQAELQKGSIKERLLGKAA